MRIAIFLLSLLPTSVYCCTGTIQQRDQDHDTLLVRELRNYDTVGVATALSEWRLDSLGCLQLRTVGMADYLIKELQLVGKTIDEVVALLGPPNERTTYQDWWQDREDVFLFVTYYIGIPCPDGKPAKRGLNHCWLRLQVDTKTMKILAAVAPCS